jgi:hypothetical protein
VPQPPQLAGSVLPLISQPSDTVPLQLRKPGLQLLMAQVPVLQTGVAFGVVHAAPHAPQLLRLVLVFSSQPLAKRASQSA